MNIFIIMLYYVTMHGSKNIKFDKCFSPHLFKSRNIGTVTKLWCGWRRNSGLFPEKCKRLSFLHTVKVHTEAHTAS